MEFPQRPLLGLHQQRGTCRKQRVDLRLAVSEHRLFLLRIRYGGSDGWHSATLTVNPPASCSLPWGGSIVHGASVTAYQASTVPYGSSCVSQTRSCSNGSLSGSYQYQSCT